MEKYQEERAKAKRNIQIADHLIYVTYKLINDPKLLLAVMENIFLALTNSMSALLSFERIYKRVPAFSENFESKFTTFNHHCVQRFNIDPSYLRLLRDVKEIITEHKQSPIEFARKDSFVICSESYNIRTLSINKIKIKITKTKEFVDKIDEIISKNERLFRRS